MDAVTTLQVLPSHRVLLLAVSVVVVVVELKHLGVPPMLVLVQILPMLHRCPLSADAATSKCFVRDLHVVLTALGIKIISIGDGGGGGGNVDHSGASSAVIVL